MLSGAGGADTRGRRPSERVHVGARVGRHVAGGFASGGPTGIVGPGNIGGTVTLWWRWELPYLTAMSPSISSVWDYVPTRFLFCRWRGDTTYVGSHGEDVDRVDPSPRDLHQSTCLKKRFKWYPRWTTRGRARKHGSASDGCGFLCKWKQRAIARSSSDGRDLHRELHRSNGWWWTLPTITAYEIARSWPSPHLKRYRTATKTRGRTPRSRSDRTAIATQSSHNRGNFGVESLPWDRTAVDYSPVPQSTPDRDPIVARSWPDRGENGGQSEAIWGKIVLDSKPIRKLRLRQWKPPPRRLIPPPRPL